NLLLAGGIEKQSDFRGRSRQSPQKSARRHRADEHAAIASMSLHPDAIAEDRPARVRTCRIDRDNADLFLLRAIVSAQAIDKSAFAGAGSPGYSGEVGPPGARKNMPQQLLSFRQVVLNRGDCPGDGTHVASAHFP